MADAHVPPLGDGARREAPDHGLHFSSHRYTAIAPGPRLVVLGAVHGNETCGTDAIRRAIAAIGAGNISIQRGSVTFVPVANPLAYARQTRGGDRNLNRKLLPGATPTAFEDHVANWLCPLLAEHDVLLDLHSFHTAGDPFVMLGPENNTGTLEGFERAAEEQALALHVGVQQFVDGWLDTYARGTQQRAAEGSLPTGSANTESIFGIGTTEYMRRVGGYGVTLECGQHDDPDAAKVAYRAIRNTLAFLAISGEQPPQASRQPLHMRIHAVVDKTHGGDTFARPWSSFDPLTRGDRIGIRHDGSLVLAPYDGFIVFPNPGAAAGEEWFYLAKRGTRF